MKSKNLEALLAEIKNSPEVQTYLKLQKLVDENELLKAKLDHMHEVEQQMVNARELGLENAYISYKKEYDAILQGFEEDVLVSSYLTSKEELSELFHLVTETIENDLNKVINQ